MKLKRVIHNDGFGINKYFYRINKNTEGVRFYDKNKQYFNNGIRVSYEQWFNEKYSDKRFYI